MAWPIEIVLCPPQFSPSADEYAAERRSRRGVAEGQAAGVSGTPSFVLGRVTKDRIEGVKFVGAMPYAVLDAKMKGMLEQKSVK